MTNWIKWILIVIYVCACNTPDILDMDKEQWINDENGCMGYRAKVYPNILKEKEKLMGLSNDRIIQLLGQPNINELYTRNQKFFVYRISSDSTCSGVDAPDSDLFIIFRFNATGLVNEIYQNDMASPTE